MATDPVCRMQVEESKAAATAEREGKTYYFCCADCQEKFVKAPEKYIAPIPGSAPHRGHKA